MTENVRELDASPSLAPLFARAALGALPGLHRRATALPDTGLALAGVRVDRDHLAEYDRVCGFRLSDELPLTYPHLLGFGLQTALMAGANFPFPMIGLVHVANRITSTRPLGADEPLVVRVHAADLRPHERGTQFDLVTAVLADGEPVWTEASTYLRRHGGGGSDKPRERAEPPEPDAVWRLPGDLGRRYARVSGDHNPIHLHPLTARPFGFRGAIAHGMWSLARSVAFFEGRLPVATTVDVQFKLPIPLPSTVGFSAAADGGGWRFAVTGRGNGKPHLAGTIA